MVWGIAEADKPKAKQVGSQAWATETLGNRASNRPDQTVEQRIAEQRGNFFYGGSATGAADAATALRNNVEPYGQAFIDIGQNAQANAAAAFGRAAPLYQQGLDAQGRGSAFSMAAAQDLYNRAQQGPGPSAAQAQLNASTAAGMRQQLALAGSGRGAGGGASAFRQAAANQAQMQGAANAQAATLRAQEEAAWRQQQAGMIAQASQLAQSQQAQDLAAAGYYTGANQQQTQLNDAAALGYGQQALGAFQGGAQTQLGVEQGAHNINMGALQGGSGYEQLLAQVYGINRGVGIQQQQIDAQREAAMWSAAGTAVGMGTMAASSDIRAKEGVQSGDQDIRNMFAALQQQDDERARQQRIQMGGQLGGQIGMAISDSREKKALSQENAALKRALSEIKPPEYGAPAAYPNVGQRALASELDRLKASQTQALQGPRASYPTPRAPDTAALDGAAALQAVGETQPWSYRYKNPERHGQGTHYGPMAQELAKTPVGRSTLTQAPDGTLAVDTGRLALVNTAALAAKQKEDDALRKELDQVKAKLKKEGRWEERR